MMLEVIFRNIIELTLACSAVVVLLLLTPLLSKRYPARWRCWIWLTLAIRFALPVNFTLPLLMVSLPVVEQQLAIDAPDTANVSSQTTPSASSRPKMGDTASPPPIQTAQPIPAPVRTASIWLVGTIASLIWQFGGCWWFSRSVRRWKQPAVSPRVNTMFDQISCEMNLEGKAVPAFCSRVTSPMMVGLFHPVILLPHEDYSDRELRFILSHECCHLKRHDLWIKLMIILARSLHWFNPVVHLTAHAVYRDIEISCDEQVVAGLSTEERGLYGDTILATLRTAQRPSSALTTCFGSGEKALRRRILLLFDTGKKRRGLLSACSAILLVTVIASLVACSERSPEVYSNASQAVSTNSEHDEVLLAGKYALDHAADTFLWYVDALEMDLTVEPWISHNGYSYYPVIEFQTLQELHNATERIFSKAFCEAELYGLANKEAPKFREVNGRLLSCPDIGGMGWPWQTDTDTLRIISCEENRAIIQAVTSSPSYEYTDQPFVMVREGSRWVLDSLYDFHYPDDLNPADAEHYLITALCDHFRSENADKSTFSHMNLLDYTDWGKTGWEEIILYGKPNFSVSDNSNRSLLYGTLGKVRLLSDQPEIIPGRVEHKLDEDWFTAGMETSMSGNSDPGWEGENFITLYLSGDIYFYSPGRDITLLYRAKDSTEIVEVKKMIERVAEKQ